MVDHRNNKEAGKTSKFVCIDMPSIHSLLDFGTEPGEARRGLQDAMGAFKTPCRGHGFLNSAIRIANLIEMVYTISVKFAARRFRTQYQFTWY